jgi:hypothetical protein
VIEWGDGIYGAQAAARRYYAQPVSDLEPAEAAGLAAMIPNPRRINPLVDPRRHARAQRRVLWLMASAGYIERDAAGLGTEPPPEPVEDAEEDEVPPPSPATAPASATVPSAATPVPTPEPTPPPTPEPEATPGVR